jgi:type IV pilus assembly protein PilN
MIRINLLPHRQLKREARQREFGLMAAFSAVAACLVIFTGWTFINGQLDGQNKRNSRLEAANIALDKEIAEIKDLKDQISAVLERKQVVENLQSNRSQAVVVLDELSRKLPEGMYYKSIKQTGNTIKIEGIADANARVATLVRSLSESAWLELPNLVEIKAVVINSTKQNAFTLTVNIKEPKLETDELTQAKPSKLS